MSDPAPQPGWYPDPEDAARERWWNGTAWSDERRTPTFGARPDPYAPAVASPYVASYGAPAYGGQTNGLALAGLLVGAVGWLVAGVLASIAGIILSGFGLAKAKEREAAGNPQSGRGMAMAGLVVGIVGTALGALVVVAYLAFLVNIGYAY